MLYWTQAGNVAASSLIRARTRSATSRALVPGSWYTVTPTASWPSKEEYEL
jgi:hypothetical protein